MNEMTSTLATLTKDASTLTLKAPTVGVWRNAPVKGSLVLAGQPLGEIVVLGRIIPIVAPKGARGVVVEVHTESATQHPVAFGDVLLVLDANVGVGGSDETAEVNDEAAAEGLSFVSPMSGRFYCRPSPDQEPFIKPGDVLSNGTTLGLLEVMKTFNRVTYKAGDGLPERAVVLSVVPSDGDDVTRGAPLVQLKAK